MSDIVLSAGVRQNLLSLQKTADLSSLTQNRLATGKKVNSALDNPTNFFTSQALQNRATDLNALLDSIVQAQKTLEAADQGLTSLAKLVQSAKSLALQARQTAEPQVTYQAVGQTGTGVLNESVGTFTGAVFAAPGANGNVDFTVTVAGVAHNLSAALLTTDDVNTTRTKIQAAIDANANTIGRVAVTVQGGNTIRFAAADSDVDINILGSATAQSVGLTAGAGSPANDRAIASQNFLDQLPALLGQNLTVTGNGGTPVSVVFGNGLGQVSNLADLQSLLAGSGVTASLTLNGANRNLTLSVPASTGTQNSLDVQGTAAATLGITTGPNNGVANAPVVDPTRANLQTQYNAILTQIDALAKDSSYNGINLLYGDNLKVVFNEKGTSSMTITGVTFDIAGLGLATIAGTGFQANVNIDAVLDTVDAALAALRTQGSNYGATLSTVQTRQDFTRNLITTLQTGADALVLADTNEEGANMLALQTRQQLSTTALSLANQAAQAVLRLFG